VETTVESAMWTLQSHHMMVPSPSRRSATVEVAERTEVLTKVLSRPIHGFELGESVERVVVG
jgi:hypothetical protein